MQSQAADVPAYIAEAPADRHAALKKLRALCRKHFPSAKESIEYGMPVYKRGEQMYAAFASQKGYIALYGMTSKVIDRHKLELKGVNCGKGCIRYTKPEKIDFALVETMMTEAAAIRAAQPDIGC